MKTYGCKKCGYIAICNSDQDLILHEKEHSKICDGKLEIAEGECLFISLKNILKNSNYLFCYSFLNGKIKGQKFIHSWNEVEGYMEEVNGEFVLKFKDMEEKQKQPFVIDFSSSKKLVMKRKDYYKHFGIDKKEVKRLKIIELLEIMKESVIKTTNCWDFVGN